MAEPKETEDLRRVFIEAKLTLLKRLGNCCKVCTERRLCDVCEEWREE